MRSEFNQSMDRRTFLAGSALMRVSGQLPIPVAQEKRYQQGLSPWPV